MSTTTTGPFAEGKAQFDPHGDSHENKIKNKKLKKKKLN
jgi:hypothetical protein